jgi:hypothetical protein
MLIDPAKLVELVKAYQKTLELLNQLEALGFKYKKLAFLDFEPATPSVWWKGIGKEDGIVHFPLAADARSIAHEMGHGFYEHLKDDYHVPPEFLTDDSGEDFAEAIRFWVEQLLGPDQTKPLQPSAWQPRHTKLIDAVHGSFDEFKNWLRSLPGKGSQPATGAATIGPLSPKPAP